MASAQVVESRLNSLLEMLTGFAETMSQDYELSDVLHDFSERVTAVLGITGAGVSFLNANRIVFVTAHDDLLASIERVQEHHQQGPCVDAASHAEVVAVRDLRDALARWPDYAYFATEHGVRAVAEIPMRIGDATIGALSLYHDTPHTWTDDELATARVLADIATSYVLNAEKLDAHRRTAEQLQRALDSRVVIEQAKGIIAAQQRIRVDDAYKVLRKHANDHRATLRATAEAVVNLGLRPSVRGNGSAEPRA